MSTNFNKVNLQRFNSAPVQKKNEINILTPDDNDFDRLAVEMVLKEVQKDYPQDTFNIHKAKDDIEAATILQEQHDKNEDIDFIWSDNDMRSGGNQGLLLLNRVNSATSQERARPLLAMNSATSMPERLRAAAGSLGAQFFSKPVKKKELSTFYAANRNEILLRKAHKSGSSFNMSNPPNELPAEVQALLDKKNDLLS
jgi:CheY-like chemotaxis protein